MKKELILSTINHPSNTLDPEAQNALFYFNFTEQKYAVVLHRGFKGEVIYVGISTTSEAFSTSQIETNMEWQAGLRDAGGVLGIEIIGLFEHKVDAIKWASDLRWKLKPRTMGARHGHRHVRSMNTGRIYDNARHAAQEHAISPGAMSNHLNRKRNYETIHKMRFEWIEKHELETAAARPLVPYE